MASLSSAAVGTEDVGTVGEEAAADQRGVTLVTDEAVAVPVALFKRDELGSSQSGDWLGTSAAFLGEELTEALGAVRFLLAGGELLPGENLVAVVTSETIPVPWGALVCDSSFVDHPIALHAALSVLLLIAWHAHHLHITWDEALVSDWLLANLAAETLLMPLLSLVLVFLHSSAEDIATAVASCGKAVVMAVSTVEFLRLGCKWLVNQTVLTVTALEAFLMPVLVLVRQILRVSADGSLTLLAAVGEEVLVALDAVGFLLTENVAVTCQIQVTVEARKVPAMPVLVHRFGVLTRKYQLWI